MLSSTGELGGSFDHGKAHVDDRRTTHVRRQVRDLISTQPAAVSLSRRAGALHVRVHADDEAVGHRVRRTRRARREHRRVRRLDRAPNASGGTFLFDWGNTRRRRDAVEDARFRDRGALGDGCSATARRLEQRVSLSRFSTRLDLGAGSLTLAQHGDRHAARRERSRRTPRRTNARSATTPRRTHRL